MDDFIYSRKIPMDGISATVQEHRRPRHHLIFPRNFLIAGDECFMANALVFSWSCENSDDHWPWDPRIDIKRLPIRRQLNNYS